MDISHACLAHSPGTGSPGTTTGIYLPDCNGPHNGPPVHHYHQIIRNQRHISTTAWQQLHAAFSMPNVTECRSSVNSKKENQNITSSRCFTKKNKILHKRTYAQYKSTKQEGLCIKQCPIARSSNDTSRKAKQTLSSLASKPTRLLNQAYCLIKIISINQTLPSKGIRKKAISSRSHKHQ